MVLVPLKPKKQLDNLKIMQRFEDPKVEKIKLRKSYCKFPKAYDGNGKSLHSSGKS